MSLFRFIAAGILALHLIAPDAAAVKIATYNLLNYTGSNRAIEFRAITSGIQADILIVEEIASVSAPDAFLNNVLNAAGGPGGYAKASFQMGPNTSNALFYRPAKFTFNAGDPDSFKVLPTELRDINRWKLRLAGYTSNEAVIYVYAMHLKSSSGSQYVQQRASEAAVARADANALPAGTNFIYVGDLNVYTSTEDAYDVQLTGITLDGDEDGRGFDPINQPGVWTNNSFFRMIHTQSTCSSGTCAPGAATGGMDDRFDFVLISAALKDMERFDYVPGSYIAYGNDGQHFNLAIDGNGFNNAVGLAMAQNLRMASDHLPVRAEFQVPARIATSSMDFGTAIVGSDAQRTLTVANSGDLALFGYVDTLEYTLPAAPGGFSGPAGSFTAAAGTGGNAHVYTMDTAAPGPRSGSLAVSSNSDTPSISVAFTGSVVTHARPSTSGTSLVTSAGLDFGTPVIGGSSTAAAEVFNYGYSSTQAQLDVYSAEITGPDAARFSIVGGFTPTIVASSPASFNIKFNSGGAVCKAVYSATLIFHTRDPIDVTGGTTLSSLSFALSAGLIGSSICDYNCDGQVGGHDLQIFLSCSSEGGLGSLYDVLNLPAGCTLLPDDNEVIAADHDQDFDLDQSDFAVLQRCFSDYGEPPPPGCAN